MDHPVWEQKAKAALARRDPAHKKGLRTVAAIEFAKGMAAIVIALGALALVHKDLWDLAESLLEFLHINTDRRVAQQFLDLADRVTDAQLVTFAIAAFGYATIRLVEAYGLWKTRVWAEWLAILSGLIFLPIEIRELLIHATRFKWAVLLVNLALLSYVAWVRFSERRRGSNP
ncbi:MAG TPA: DUF2127 domain-containing protein [Terriglobales bacterium]|jgi:uncharacterized membrane protein (DUF2068 family)